jgi:hypothetical protein
MTQEEIRLAESNNPLRSETILPNEPKRTLEAIEMKPRPS